MQPDESLGAFRERLTTLGQGGTRLTPAAGIAAMIAFFREVTAANCDPSDGDRLLFQWGTYDWGRGERFELDITRQFCTPSGEDDGISQLSLTFLFTPDAQLAALGQGNHWCSGLDDMSEGRT